MTRDELIAYLRNVARVELVDFLNDVGDELIEDGLISEEWGEEVLCDDRGKLLDEVFTDTLTLMKQNAAYELNCDVEDLKFYSWPVLGGRRGQCFAFMDVHTGKCIKTYDGYKFEVWSGEIVD